MKKICITILISFAFSSNVCPLKTKLLTNIKKKINTIQILATPENNELIIKKNIIFSLSHIEFKITDWITLEAPKTLTQSFCDKLRFNGDDQNKTNKPIIVYNSPFTIELKFDNKSKENLLYTVIHFLYFSISINETIVKQEITDIPLIPQKKSTRVPLHVRKNPL